MTNNILEIKNLHVEYTNKKGVLSVPEIIHAVNNLSLEIKEGEVFAIAGESGCGKSTLAKTIIRLEDSTAGNIYFENEDITKEKNLKGFRKKVQMIFQNPYASLNPKMKIYDILKEPLRINTNLSDEEIEVKIKELIKEIGIDENCLKSYPHEFSGGQRQRIAIARALILEPKFVIADEPVSALDVSIQAQILNLLKKLQIDHKLTILFISHDISVIKFISDKIAIMYLGEIVEQGTCEEIFKNAKHPYTKILLEAAPSFNKKKENKAKLTGDLPSPANLPKGCKFHTRCPHCMPECAEKIPNKTSFSDTHSVKCFLYKNL